VLIVNRGLLLLDSTAYQGFVIKSPVMLSPSSKVEKTDDRLPGRHGPYQFS
jgi:hypothetical protein